MNKFCANNCNTLTFKREVIWSSCAFSALYILIMCEVSFYSATYYCAKQCLEAYSAHSLSEMRWENNLQETHQWISYKTGQTNNQLLWTDNEPFTDAVVIVLEKKAKLKTFACIFTEIMTVLTGKMSNAQVNSWDVQLDGWYSWGLLNYVCALHPPENALRYKYLCHMVIQKDISAVLWRAAHPQVKLDK